MTQMRAIAALLALVALALPAAAADSPAGRWRLVEQSYGKGQNNLVSPDEPLWLELAHGPAGWSGALQAGSERAARYDWPALVGEGAARSLDRLTIRAVPETGGVEASYRVPPMPGQELTLWITERYRLDGPDRLVGVVEVRFERDGKSGGSYTLQRRYVRER